MIIEDLAEAQGLTTLHHLRNQVRPHNESETSCERTL
jgi:hypothetical protein